MKKILVGSLTLLAVVVAIPMFSAFEAHVINVTAKIENALSVNTNSINFGTVFPQEHLDQPLSVALSQSFIDEPRVDEVNYFIRQKPKCAITTSNGTAFDSANTATGHIVVDANAPGGYTIDCGTEPRALTTGESWGVLPSLCEYISKEGEDANDETLASFHTPWTINGSTIDWTDTNGVLSKSGNDTTDNWTIDLAVPCFGGYCAQDWASFVTGINPSADPTNFTQDIANQHKIFGCDLWVEVGGVNEGEIVVPPATANLTITKIIDNNDGVGTTTDPNAFLLTVNSLPVLSGSSTSVTAGVPLTIGEAQLPGYQFVSIVGTNCPADLATPITLNSGDNVTCTITNLATTTFP